MFRLAQHDITIFYLINLENSKKCCIFVAEKHLCIDQRLEQGHHVDYLRPVGQSPKGDVFEQDYIM